MRMLLKLCIVSVVCVLFMTAIPFAGAVEHYGAKDIVSTEDAVHTLTAIDSEITVMVAAESLSVGDLEVIHEKSYTLEAAIDKLIKDKTYAQEAMDAVDEAVQAIHFGSEKHEEATVRTWSPKLTATIAALTADPVAHKTRVHYHIIIKDHKFVPDTFEIPAGQKIKLIVENQDPTPEEFESHDFHREKIILGNSKAVILIGPLKPGEYKFFGEFNEATAQGKVIVK